TYKWSLDENYLYLIPVLENGSGFYAPGYFLDNYSLYRLNLTTGEFQSILSRKGKNGYSFSLSQNGEYLAYSEFGNKLVHMRNMYNDEEKLFNIEGDYVLSGIFVW